MDVRAARERRKPSQLTPMQFALWKGQKLQPGVPLYNMAHTFRIRGPLDPEEFAGAFKSVVAGTDILRAVVVEKDGAAPEFQILDAPPVRHQFSDVSNSADPDARLRSIVEAQMATDFATDTPLYDSQLVRVKDTEHVWCLTLHHLIVDFLSVAILFRRMSAMLESGERNLHWPSFTDYSDWLVEQQGTPRKKRAASYWERNLPPADQVPLEAFGNTLSGNNPRAERIELRLSAERSQRIESRCAEAPFRTLSRDLGILNFFATVLWAFLYRTSNRDRLTVGTPLHNRSSAAFRDTAGLLINILPISESVNSDDTFASLASRLGLSTLDATKYAAFPPPQGEMHRGFDAVLNFLTGEVGEFAGMPCDFTWRHTGFADPHHAVRLQVQDFAASGEFTLYLDFNADLLSGLERHRIADSFLLLVDACLDNTDSRLGAISLLPERDRVQLLDEFNATQRKLTDARSLNELIAPQWTDSKDLTAIRFRDTELSYGELNARVTSIASWLQASGIGKGDVVAVWMRRSPDFIASILAAMRLGAAYVPLDPAQPIRRIERVLRDAEPGAIVSDESSVPLDNCPVLDPATLQGGEDRLEPVNVSASDAAYMIYTSGSTGEPKGVIVEHHGIVNYVAWAAEQYVHSADLNRPAMPFYTSPAVDLTLTSLFLPLTTGGSIVIYEADDLRNDLSIVDVFRDDAVDILKLTPAHLSLLQKLERKASRIGTLILGGENLTTTSSRQALSLFPSGVAIYNEYGPTETVVGCMIHRYNPAFDAGDSVPIGKPISNMRIYALDRHEQPVPPGVVGELYVAGDGVARGYRNRPEQNRQSFVALPDLGEARAYRTGDLGRFGSDGLLTYLGRRDEQLKIRGNRVELGDIEACLHRHPGIVAAGVAVEEKRQDLQSATNRTDQDTLCQRCGLPANYPQALIDPDTGICELCRQYDQHKERIDGYFRERAELEEIVRDIVDENGGVPNAIALTSGGKDSTYALHQLVRMGLTPLVFTLDNGFISEQALDNVRKVVDELGLELVIGSTPHMNDIFTDSLARHCNVCNGCFKTIYTMSINLAIERGIDYIFTGLSRGQLFETRLAPEMFAGEHYSMHSIEQNIRAARVAYHRRHDAVNERLDVSAFADDGLFERIRIIDFYRYWDVGLEELYEFLKTEAGWTRPADTGRSTNCLINEAGISVHKTIRGYHNYALPYSWDVRLGHKTRGEALHELNDEIDDDRVSEMLNEIGFSSDAGGDTDINLIAAYTAEQDVNANELRQFLEKELPSYMIPHQLYQVDELPLTGSGKLDRRRLGKMALRESGPRDDTQASNELEQAVSNIWLEVLNLERLGVYENFFELGGTSLPALQIVARCEQAFDIELPLAGFFADPTVAGLAEMIETILIEQLEALSDEEAEQALQRLEKEDA